MEVKPLYKTNRLIVGNRESNTGIVTLWSKSSEIAKSIDKKHYALMGNLYSAERGLDILIRNLLANPQITNLIITGIDFSKSGVVLRDFFEKGFERGRKDVTEQECWRVKSSYEGYIEKDISEQALQDLRKSMHVVHTNDITKFDFSSLPSKAARKQYIFMKKEEATKRYEGEDIGYIIRGKTIAECWLKILDTILKFGAVSGTHYDDQQKEIVNLMSIISEEDPSNLYIPEFFPSDRQHVNEYIPRITRDLPGGTHKNEYTYGSRMRSWFGVDQIANAIEKLAREPISRAVVISLWDSQKDMTVGGSPCLNHIWFRIRDKKLNMTCVFRSHDMFEGYPENAFGLRVLQEEVRSALIEKLREKGDEQEINLGSLVILSQSAHIYDDSWERCSQIVKKYLTRKHTGHMSTLDPRGNLIISIENSEIRLEHTSTTNETLGVYTAKSAEEMRDLLIHENIISLTSHALDIGMELQKAEHALLLGIDYVQDNALKLKK